MTLTIEATGVDEFTEYLETFPDIAPRALALALNDTARDALAGPIKDAIMAQTAFPAGYLDDPSRIGVNIFARHRATSLARFVTGGAGQGGQFQSGLVVTVNPSSPISLDEAFLVPLRSGNTGLAIRLGAGQQPRDTTGAVSLGKGLWLLYGASVDQVFSDVAGELSEPIADMLTAEFFRQFDVQLTRQNNGG